MTIEQLEGSLQAYKESHMKKQKITEQSRRRRIKKEVREVLVGVEEEVVVMAEHDRFMNLDQTIRAKVSFGDDSQISILRKAKDGNHKHFELGQLLEHGYDIHMKDYNSLLIRDQKGELIARVKMSKNRMFPLNDDSWLWHLRFGHLNFGSLEQLSKKEMVRGVLVIPQPDQLCTGCLLGKQFRKSFPKEA
ncbi:hypothetical protein V2J09_010736 [Rumex salicifolius]